MVDYPTTDFYTNLYFCENVYFVNFFHPLIIIIKFYFTNFIYLYILYTFFYVFSLCIYTFKFFINVYNLQSIDRIIFFVK